MFFAAVALGVVQGAPEQLAAFWESTDFFAALVGGGLACFGAFIAVRESARQERKKRHDEERQEIMNYRKAIRSEIVTLWDQYMIGVGSELEKADSTKPFEILYPVGQNYFVFYDSNMSTLAKINDDEEREKIIETYIVAKGLIDSYMYNNSLNEKMDKLHEVPQEEGNYVMNLRVVVFDRLKDYCRILQDAHVQARVAKSNLVALIDK